MTHTPESPPATPVVPRGLATTLGIIGTTILGLASALTTVLAGYHGHETRLLATLATVVAVATILGRMAQAIAKELAGSKVRFSPALLGQVGESVREGVGELENVRKPTRRTPKP